MTGVAGCGIIATRIVSCYGRYGMVSLPRVRMGEEWFLFLAGLPSLVVGALLVKVAGRVDLLRIGYFNITH